MIPTVRFWTSIATSSITPAAATFCAANTQEYRVVNGKLYLVVKR